MFSPKLKIPFIDRRKLRLTIFLLLFSFRNFIQFRWRDEDGSKLALLARGYITINPLKTRYAHNLFPGAHITRVIAVQWMYSAVAIAAVNHGEARKNLLQPRWNENATCLVASRAYMQCMHRCRLFTRNTALHPRMNYVNHLFARALFART